ncbi:hypothetical protein SESBI_15556 [Sesbania bispinosa]|nr:hypothetical protein SESBI_15556 [Sesbania bispinosa]
MKGDVGPSKLNELESFFGSTVPEKVDILPPQPSNTKGCGKRIKGGKEKAMEQQQKKTRLCTPLFGKYDDMGVHFINMSCTRNCYLLFAGCIQW